MIIQVEEHPGHKPTERPGTFRIRRRVFKVVDVLDRWYGNEQDYIKVQADDGYTYIILYDRAANEWRLVSLARTGNCDKEKIAYPLSSRKNLI